MAAAAFMSEFLKDGFKHQRTLRIYRMGNMPGDAGRSEKTSHKVQARMHGTRWRRLVELLMLRENLALERLCQGRWPLEQAAEIVLSGWYGMGFSWRFSF